MSQKVLYYLHSTLVLSFYIDLVLTLCIRLHLKKLMRQNCGIEHLEKCIFFSNPCGNYTNPGYGLSLVDTLWNAGSYRQPLEQEGNPMT